MNWKFKTFKTPRWSATTTRPSTWTPRTRPQPPVGGIPVQRRRQNDWFKGGANPVLLDSMKKDGAVDQTTLKNAITIDGDPVSYTNEDSTRITTWLQDNWDKTIGN